MVTLFAVNMRFDGSGLLAFLDVINLRAVVSLVALRAVVSLVALRAVVGLLALRAVNGLLAFLAVVMLVFFGTFATASAFTCAIISVHGITLADVLHGKSIVR